MIGQTVSHYKILAKIGQGGMSEVYLAQDTTLDRKVALKFLLEELEQNTRARKRFLREAKSAAALDHPYICHVHEVGEVEGKSFISMEYVQGETLKDKLAQGPLPLNDVLEKATEVAEALEEAHKQGIVHRDLKPSNVMLTPQGHVKVMDFGLAKRVTPVEGQEEEITTALTREGSTLGTIPYMSPEQIRGQAVDTQSDIFSFGVVLFEMLTGVHPFKKASPLDTASSILRDEPSPLSDYVPELPEVLQHTVQKMLAKRVEDRCQSAAEVRIDLEQLASLNHPKIAAIYGLEEADGVRFLSLELVEGETLTEQLTKGPLPVEEALEVCRQMGEGVEAAHEKSVIHRDSTIAGEGQAFPITVIVNCTAELSEGDRN